MTKRKTIQTGIVLSLLLVLGAVWLFAFNFSNAPVASAVTVPTGYTRVSSETVTIASATESTDSKKISYIFSYTYFKSNKIFDNLVIDPLDIPMSYVANTLVKLTFDDSKSKVYSMTSSVAETTAETTSWSLGLDIKGTLKGGFQQSYNESFTKSYSETSTDGYLFSIAKEVKVVNSSSGFLGTVLRISKGKLLKVYATCTKKTETKEGKNWKSSSKVQFTDKLVFDGAVPVENGESVACINIKVWATTDEYYRDIHNIAAEESIITDMQNALRNILSMFGINL
jgi:hypothetical protein